MYFVYLYLNISLLSNGVAGARQRSREKKRNQRLETKVLVFTKYHAHISSFRCAASCAIDYTYVLFVPRALKTRV